MFSLTLQHLRRVLAIVVGSWCVLASSAALAQLTDVSTVPLFGGRQPHPNVVVTTSVEFPTVGSAYLNIGYAKTTTYLGYFDPTRCYTYSGTSSTGFFVIDSLANANHECTSSSTSDFSGNVLNWLTMSAIDEFRYAITGGNRISETGANSGVTLERAFLPDGTVNGVSSFYNLSSNFPQRQLDSGFSSSLTAVLPNAVTSLSNTVFVNNCKTFVYFSKNSGGSCGNPPSPSQTYHVAVVVCDSSEGPVRTDLCLQYGGSTGKYKPVGQAQVNADKMRFAVFGYLMDHNTSDGYTVPSGCDDGSSWSRCRYGGVLRSPMKYLGPSTYDANQNQSTNTRAEINADGTLVANPEGTALVAALGSGFINYINKFGADGVYKRYDPAGEMYYEAIRYYEGQQPTPQAISGTLTTQAKGNYPFLTTWTDPIGSICSANYIINVSDANTWDDTYLPGYNGSPSAGFNRPASRAVDSAGLDAYLWTGRIGTLESTTSSLVTDDVRPGLANIATTNTANSASWAVAGAAFWANVSDIRTDLAGKQTVKTISVDVAEASIDIHDRQLYLMGKYGGFTNTIDRTSDAYPNPFYSSNPVSASSPAIRSNTEWADATNLPTNYVLASDPTKLINGLRNAFSKISASSGTLSGAALTSANLTFGAAGAYIATFDPATWSGSVLFNSLSVDSSGNLVVSPLSTWDAGAALTTLCGTIPAASTNCSEASQGLSNGRKIFTTISLLGVRTAEPFTTLGVALDLNYTVALGSNPATGIPDLQSTARLNYLRGYRVDEGSALGYRVRKLVMGDIVNSGPVFEGAPDPNVSDSTYQAFLAANVNRQAAVYVGANDGMLHAFNATTGSELFAYIPGYSYKDLAALTDPGYVHDVYVDTVPVVKEAKVSNTWKTVLVGANGAGAQGVFALDVTNPSTFGTGNVMFEFSDADDPDFGSVLQSPEIAKLCVAQCSTISPTYRWFAVVTGYNNRRTTVNGKTDGNVSTDTTNKGVLFLLALDHVLGQNWTINVDYYKFKFPATNPAVANALGPVTLSPSRSGDGSTAFLYFGDLQGNLWKFNVSTGSPSTWVPVLGTLASPTPIFVAQDATNHRQPITARVELSTGPGGSTLVFFGTGKFLGTSDLTLPGSTQTEYALIDFNPSVAISRSTDLVARTTTVSGTNLTIGGTAFSYSGASAKKGWYLDFLNSATLGERSVTQPAVRQGLLTFTTLTLSNDLCLPGNGFIYQLDALTGFNFGGATFGAYSSTVGIPGPPRIVDLQLIGGQTQATGEVINNKTATALVSGTLGTISNPGGAVTQKAPPTQRINWREITNWNDRSNH
jgi:type IV pilus assembly protein PilY1